MNAHNITALILAGGKGTRLQSVVSDRQKTVAEVDGHPFMLLLLHQLEQAGIPKVVICTGHLPDTVHRALEKYSGPVAISYSHEKTQLGTGGAVVNALSQVHTDYVLVMNGDSYTDCNLSEFVAFMSGHPAGIVLTTVSDASRYGIVEIGDAGRITAFREKDSARQGGALINAGIYLLQTAELPQYSEPSAFSLEKDWFPSLAAAEKLFGQPVSGAFIDIGLPDSYARAVDFVRNLEREK